MKSHFKLRVLDREREDIPYHLLLLADETLEAIGRYVFDSDIVVAEEDDVIVGVCVTVKMSAAAIEIKNIAVAERLQGKGLGTLLLRYVDRCAREEGYSELWIGTGDCLFRQQQLYQREGFEITERKTNFFIDHYPHPIFEDGVQLIDMVMLRKNLI